jgi:hypothetical protein
MARKISVFLAFLVASFVLVLTSPVWKPTKVTNLEELGSVPLGFPLSFMDYRTTLTPMESDLPIYVSLTMSRHSYTYNFSNTLFIINVIITFLLILTTSSLYKKFIIRGSK